MHRIVIGLVLVLVLAMGLVGCGKSYEELHGRAATSEADLALGDDWWVYSGLYDYTFVIRSYEVME